MANASINASIGQDVGGGKYIVKLAGGSGDIPALTAAALAAAPSSTTVAANIATLVADGASPTQAHVNTLNTNWGTFLTALTAYNAAVAAANASLGTADVTIIVNKTNVTNTNQFLAIVRKVLDILPGLGIFSS